MRQFHSRDKHGRKSTHWDRWFARRRTRQPAPTGAKALTFEALEPRLPLAVVINEFLAANANGLTDQDGHHSDWIELRNTGASSVNLSGWYLTDDQNDLDKWQLPSTSVPAGGFVLVFASGKNRAVAGQQLHTNFTLEEAGEFLAIVKPGGTIVADSYAPFPQQLVDVSYGRGTLSAGFTTDVLIGEESPVKARVPISATSIDSTWYARTFNDSSWTSGTTGVGFDAASAGYQSYISLNLRPQMYDASPRRTSAYLRLPFQVTDPAVLQSLVLQIRYDDGFAVYLNGTEISSARRAVQAPYLWNSVATAERNEALAVQYESIDLSSALDVLVTGTNVLAIHAMNRSTSSDDLLIDPLLLADRELPAVPDYMVAPTPGAVNVPGSQGKVADTKFSVDRGFYENPFNVAITTATPGATIRYTTDGSTPTATFGSIYNPLNPPLIPSTTNLRAAAFKPGHTSSNVDTQTYLFLNDVIQQTGAGLPPTEAWGHDANGDNVFDPDWDMDPDIVNHPLYAGTIKNDLKAVPTVSLVMPWDDWFGSGAQGIYPIEAEIERQVSMEYFTADGSQGFQIDAGIEIQGGTSDDRWKTDKLSFRVKFKAPYGPTKLDADIFTHPLFDVGASDSFDTLVLDAQINYAWTYGGVSVPTDQRSRAKFIQDQIVSDLQNLSGGFAPHGRIVHLYINGLYWGIYMAHERPDDSFADDYLGGDKDDYDVLKHTATTVVAGDATAIANYAAMLNLARSDMTMPANYAAAEQKIDIDGLIDYMIINYYAGNDDWPHHNWYASFNRVDPNGKWRFHSWDAEHVFKSVGYNAIYTGDIGGSPEEVHQRLSLNSEYRLRFTDRVQKLLYHGGLLTPQEISAVYSARMQEADRAMVAESARWGDNRTTATEPPGAGGAYTREHWLAVQSDLLQNYFPQRTNIVLGQFSNQGWTVPRAAPLMSQYGGTVNVLSQVSLSLPGGTPNGARIYYTLDGTDPRNKATNLPNAAAILYNGSPITFADQLGKRVMARIYLDDPLASNVNEWSPLVDQTFLMEAPFPVRITELNYHPLADESHEFIELMNTGSQTVSLAGLKITQFASEPFVISGSVNLAAGERIIVAKNPAVFQLVYGTGYRLLPIGYDTASLDNSGEAIALLGPLGETLQSFTYRDSAPWPTLPDGRGPSLEIIDPLKDPSNAANWRASLYVNGSPGASGVPGDYDGNSRVDDSDHAVWRSKFGMTVGIGTSGDGNRDGVVDLTDYIIWRKAMVPPIGAGAIVADAATVARAELQAEQIALNAASFESQPAKERLSGPLHHAVNDDVFSRFDSAQPFRLVLERNASVERADDQLLLAPLVAPAASRGPGEQEIDVNNSGRPREPLDDLFADWVIGAAATDVERALFLPREGLK